MTGKPLEPILKNLLSSLQEPEQRRRSLLVDRWANVVGSRFAKHTKPRFSGDGKVVVWVDDSTLAFELSRRYKPVLLKRLRNEFGEGEVKDIRFFVGDLNQT